MSGNKLKVTMDNKKKTENAEDRRKSDTIALSEHVMFRRNSAWGDARLMADSGEISAAFRLFDEDKDGCLNRDELRNLLHMMGVDVTEEELDDVIQEADLNGDGKVDYFEFHRMMTMDDNLLQPSATDRQGGRSSSPNAQQQKR